MVTGKPFISRKMPMKSSRCIGRIFASALGAPLAVLSQNHLAYRVDSLGREEHMLGTAQPDAFGAEFARGFGVVRRIGIGAHAEAPFVRRPIS